MKKLVALLFCLLCVFISGCGEKTKPTETPIPQTSQTAASAQNVPTYDGRAYVEINGNNPYFTNDDLTRGAESFEDYSPLDSLGRCGVAYARIGKDVMPTEPRGKIGMVKPSGWQTVRYDHVDGKYLYNRCHLIGFQLAGENANPKNLITGTRYLNIEGMLPWENLVADYVKRTNHHVLYRVTPIFEGNELVARGVLMEGQSLEDDKIRFNVFAFNVQPNVEIDYATGKSRLVNAPVTDDKKAIEKSIERHKKKVSKKQKVK